MLWLIATEQYILIITAYNEYVKDYNKHSIGENLLTFDISEIENNFLHNPNWNLTGSSMK